MAPPIFATRVVGVSDLNKDASDHIYSVLPTNAIRVLRLHHGSGSQIIECSLSTTQLTNADPYEALSYVWGSEADPETLLLCHREFRITRNLHSALRALRLPYKDRILWIDALCINQGNDIEKGTQIPLMGEIYKGAGRVIAWLGSPTDDMMPGLRWLRQLVTSEDIEFYRFPNDDSIDNTHIGLELLSHCDYWNRAWIVQEIAFASLFHLQCGPFSIPYDVFRKVLELESSRLGCVLSPEPHAPNRTIAPISFRDRLIRPGSGTTGRISAKIFLDHLVDKKCGDPRDSVFAFYNLFSRELQKHLPSPSNYCEKPRDILLKAICGMISSERSLYAITIRSRQKMPIGEEDAWQLDLPSWCPYVRTSFEIDSLSVLGKFSFGIETAEPVFQNNGKLVHVRGCAIAEVSKTLAPYRHRDLSLA
ncbi:heterokaryon incompatibility protein-domain-containing protein [Diplogelasinospora grovesii]|uniref:Heterokaryon incompatibility protein-domain-containing protein n=1 Tax=Diplogelasinospora grovesii TaxID=303347 RepID=A0AAN6SAF3_9PEZI|nr:heterokaryon incompatibility protein-domain-containing protein [Diplogelasinospora grovesii]